MSQIHGKQIRDGSVGLIKWDTSTGQTALLASGSMIGITDEPVLDTDLANKKYVDNIASGLDHKESVVSKSTANISISTPPATLDDITLSSGDRILLTNQTDKRENGIYTYDTPLKRAEDSDGTPITEVSLGNFTFVEKGTQWASTGWVLSNSNATGSLIIPDTDTQEWTQFSAAGVLNGGDGIDISGNTINADLLSNGGLSISGGKIRVNETIAGNGSSMTGGVINIGQGNGIDVSANDVSVKAGTGITVDGNGVNFDGATIAGTGISWDGTQLSADPTDLSGLGGLGLDYNNGVYDVNTGNGIDIVSDNVVAVAGNGISVDGTGINVVGGNGITVTSTDVSVEAGTGIAVDGSGVHFDGTNVVGTGITWDGNTSTLNVDPTDLSGLGGLGLNYNGSDKLDVVAGIGITVGADVQAKPGNGISVDGTGINVVGGNGITVTSTDVSVEVGHGILVGATGIYLDGASIAGTGITWNGTTLNTTPVSFTDLGGEGLSWNTVTEKLDVNTGDGIDIDGDNVVAVGGNGITVDSNGINIDPTTAGNGITWTGGVTNKYSVEAGTGIIVDGTGVNFDGGTIAGTGISWDGSTLSADFGDFSSLDGNGLIWNGTSNKLDVNPGNGITISNDEVTAVGTNGILVNTNGIGLNPGVAGTGLTLNSGVLSVDPTDHSLFAGQGIVWNGTSNEYDVDTGNGITISGDKVTAVGTNGILVDTNGIGLNSTVAGSGITLSSGILSIDFTDFGALAGDGLTLTGGSLNVGAGNGISVDGTDVTAVGGNGITVSSNGINIDPTTAGQGLAWDATDSEYNLDIGVGLKFNGNEVEFDGTEMAGTGLSWIGNKLVADSTATELTSEYTNVTTTSANNENTGFDLVGTPKVGNEVKVYINGQLQRYGTGNDYYFSSTGDVTGARPIDGVESGDIFMWNSINAGYILETSDLVTVTYDTAI